MEQVIHAGMIFRPPETPRESMEFLSRSWSASSLEVSKTLTTTATVNNRVDDFTIIEDDVSRESVNGGDCNFNDFSFAATTEASSQLLMERIVLSHSEVSPRTSGCLSHGSGPLNGGQSCGSLADSPPASPSQIEDFKFCHIDNPVNTQCRPGKTVGRWLKDRKEKRKEESRAHNAQLHAAVTVAGVAAAIASIAAAHAASSGAGRDEQRAKIDVALASAATLVAAQCFEAAEAMGAESKNLSAIVSSAVNVRSAGDIMTLTAGAATALRGAATLKARTIKEVWNIAAVIPVDKGMGLGDGGGSNSSCSDEVVPVDNFLDIRSRELLAKGCELLKRTRKGDLHWKIVSVYINQMGQVMLKMKSKHVGGTFTKKKKNVVLDVCKDMPSWPGRHLLEGGEHRRYFGLKTMSRGLVEFECKNRKECDIWTGGVSRLLTIAADLKNRR